MTDNKIIRALLSVSDKTGIVELAEGLARHKVHILSTGGTAKALKEAGIAITDVSTHTEFPEIMDGRVKTLHPKIHGGILADRDNEKHIMAMETHNISQIDMVVVNLYPFVNTVKSGAGFDDCIENIDIGGPSMVRSCAKNHKHTTILTNPNQYQKILDEMDANSGETTPETRRDLAWEAFAHTAEYDANIANWFASKLDKEAPEKIFSISNLKQTLRYGENPHQSASVYSNDDGRVGVVNANQIQGKELSYNNLNDADAAFEMVCEYDDPACAIIKHANPCGLAVGKGASDAWKKALSSDPVSAFGGIVAFNCEVDEDLVEALGDIFLEVIIAPSFTDKFKKAIETRQNLRLLETNGLADNKDSSNMLKNIAGGVLVQSRDNGSVKKSDCKVVTKRKPTDTEWEDLLFAWKSVKNVKSNAIVYTKNGQTVGIGAGQMSRVDSARIGAEKADLFEGAKDSVVASDAFFPFADGLQVCIDAGITAVIQPGGSKNDDEVIKAADEAGIAMVFTGMRHFKH
ncbi:MAG: bifunctional phosphoribosylaminoimidazolecarboxamide formyltransferase/IMP cyclohydrolase [Alphaproteobacteria bacterium]